MRSRRKKSRLKEIKRDKKRLGLFTMGTVLKYLCSVILAVLAYTTTNDSDRMLFAFLDILLIFCFTNVLLQKNKHFYWLHCILLLLVNIEQIVLWFSGSEVTFVMLQNIPSLNMLAGKMSLYVMGAVVVLLCSFFPVARLKSAERASMCAFALLLVVQVCVITVIKENYSTVAYAYSILENKNALDSLAQGADEGEAREEFNQAEIDDFYSKDTCLPEQPNVILVFVEGLSQHIIDDERNIMPNISALQKQSITFCNYYNHTFATYRGLQGQLFSGHQLEDTDPNYLPSMQSILGEQGYYSAFINQESTNETFTGYLEELGFDDVLTCPYEVVQFTKSISHLDEQIFEYLFEKADELDEEESPFFLSTYIAGTHVSLASQGLGWGDGSSALLNRFYNADYYLGEFFEKFQNSALAEDTVLVVTTDHATFSDSDYTEAFPEIERECSDLDEIPLIIYYEGVEAATYQAYGRNSLDLAPTVLDLLDVSAENDFLGTSLFAPVSAENTLDMVFWDPSYQKKTRGGTVTELEESEGITEELSKYFALKKEKRLR